MRGRARAGSVAVQGKRPEGAERPRDICSDYQSCWRAPGLPWSSHRLSQCPCTWSPSSGSGGEIPFCGACKDLSWGRAGVPGLRRDREGKGKEVSIQLVWRGSSVHGLCARPASCWEQRAHCSHGADGRPTPWAALSCPTVRGRLPRGRGPRGFSLATGPSHPCSMPLSIFH